MRVKDPTRGDMIGVHLVADLQRKHVLLCNLLPLLGSITAVVVACFYPPKLGEFVALFSVWILVGIGISVGYHRYFTHGAFQTYLPIRLFLAICGAMGAQGPLLAWVATHRRHHQFSDKEGDPHSPNLSSGWWRGLWHAHFGWIVSHPLPNPSRYASELMNDKWMRWVSDNYYHFVLLGFLAPGIGLGLARHSVLGFVLGVLWGGCLRTTLGSQMIWSVNSICHTVGSKPFKTRKLSTNNSLLAIPTCGESWHNNHHAFPRSAALGLHLWQFDPGYLFIAALRSFGLIWDVYVPDAAKQATRMADADDL